MRVGRLSARTDRQDRRSHGRSHKTEGKLKLTLLFRVVTPLWDSGFLCIMAQKRPLPRICIALGLPDVPALLEHAQREAESGEAFLEFRLDFLDQPAQGAAAIRGFLERYPECIVLATCRRHQN